MEENALENLKEMLETLKPYAPKPENIIEPKESPWKFYQEGVYEIRRKL